MTITLCRAALKNVIALSICSLLISTANAEKPHQQTWVKDEITLDKSAQIYLSKEFSRKSGQFRAEPESMLDNIDNIKGSFLVGTYRYIYNKSTEEQGILVDEMESTELLDCERRYYGTLKQLKKYKGKIVAEKLTQNDDVLMIQMGGIHLDSKLCELHAGKPITPFARDGITNPNYNPNPSKTDFDALYEKYKPRVQENGQ